MPRLPDAASFRALVDGSRRGMAAAILRGLLRAIAFPYGVAVAVRNTLYDRRWLRTAEARIPVICVGNLTLGGTGKTPLVAWVARELIAMGQQPAIVSRGYAADSGKTSDEAAELAVVLPNVPHVANRDRAAGVEQAAVRYGATVAILDDGFQHRRLNRQLDIVAVDATDPFGCGYLFPRGLLREPISGVKRAGAVVLTRARSVDIDRREAIKEQLENITGRQMVSVEATHRPQCLRMADGSTRPLADLARRRVAIVSGIGNPAAFRRTVEEAGGRVVAEVIKPDHHPYPAADLSAIGGRAREADAELIVTTVKDLVKIQRSQLDGLPLVALEIAIQILGGDVALRNRIADAVNSAAVTPTREG